MAKFHCYGSTNGECIQKNEGPTMDEIHWGIIGCGDVAEHKGGPALYNVAHSRLVAVMSRRAGRAEPE